MAQDFLVAFDTTGSMRACIYSVRRKVEETVKKLFSTVGDLRIAVGAFGDYCDRDDPYITTILPFTSSEKEVCKWIRELEHTWGGDAPEAYERILHEARALDWRADAERTFVLIGDDVPHEPSYRDNVGNIDWKLELAELVKAGIKMYPVHCMPGSRQHSKWFYEEVAQVSGGKYLTLDQFAQTDDVIYAVCFGQQSPETLKTFRDEVIRDGRMSRNMASVFSSLGEETEAPKTASKLDLVPPGTYQILMIDEEMPIKQFIEKNGLLFKKGLGFYKFTGRGHRKRGGKEMIQEKKVVVLRDDKTGDLYSGEYAREMIGVPLGTRAKIAPPDIEGFTPFVQSTSYNRILEKGTEFLYKVVDSYEMAS